jgi:Arc-like DNA binding domain
MAKKKSEVVGLRLRMPAGVHRLLVKSANSNNRSLNSEILWALAKYLGGDAQMHVEQAEAHRREVLHNVLRALARDPESAARMIANLDKRMEDER